MEGDLNMRASRAELAAWERLAAERGLSLSAWCRMVLNDRVELDAALTAEPSPSERAIVAEARAEALSTCPHCGKRTEQADTEAR